MLTALPRTVHHTARGVASEARGIVIRSFWLPLPEYRERGSDAHVRQLHRRLEDIRRFEDLAAVCLRRGIGLSALCAIAMDD